MCGVQLESVAVGFDGERFGARPCPTTGIFAKMIRASERQNWTKIQEKYQTRALATKKNDPLLAKCKHGIGFGAITRDRSNVLNRRMCDKSRNGQNF